MRRIEQSSPGRISQFIFDECCCPSVNNSDLPFTDRAAAARAGNGNSCGRLCRAQETAR